MMCMCWDIMKIIVIRLSRLYNNNHNDDSNNKNNNNIKAHNDDHLATVTKLKKGHVKEKGTDVSDVCVLVLT